jgi:hypothetical protein
LLAKGRKPTMAPLTLARKIAANTLIVWKNMPTSRLCRLLQESAVGRGSRGL